MRPWLLLSLAISTPARADFNDGVSDDRLHLPSGPGSLQGIGDNVSIDHNMGVLQQQIAIELPAGFPGATPSLSLSYGSSSASGELGMGWSLPVPSVERMTARGLPTYVAGDAFVADGGEELVQVQSASDQAVFRARFESGFVRWVWHSPGAEGYWEAQEPDGGKAFFGADRNGTLVPPARVAGAGGTFRYHLVETVDPFGHRVRYDYVTDGGYALLSTVSWLFYDDQNSKARYSAALSYEPRPDVISDGNPGTEIRLGQRLHAIDVYYNGMAATERVRGYLLSYDGSTGLSQLVKVQSFGLDDTADATAYPVVHSFAYTQSIGSVAGRSLATVAQKLTGAAVAGGEAQLIDLNGDGLPDVVDATAAGAHQIWLAQLSSDGTLSFIGPKSSAVGTQSDFPIGAATVTPLDVNGDGFTDLVNGANLKVLINNGSGDWSSVQPLTNLPSQLSGGAIRFFDYDGDKKVDVLASTGGTTTVFRNRGDFSFENGVTVAPLADFAANNVQMADMNGDGLLDVVEVLTGSIRYTLNLGWGRWSAGGGVQVDFPLLQEVDFHNLLIEDINGDGLADLVLPTADGKLQYALNQNGTNFDVVQTISSVNGVAIPTRTSTTTVVCADLNGNGSHDVVWIDDQGQVQYLDLFAVRPNLLTHVENGIGHVQDIRYVSSVIQMARSREAGTPWQYRIPFAMTLVDQVDDWDKLTNLHEVSQYQYRDGFYDGVERQYRGQAHVETHMLGDASLEDGLLVEDYDVGSADPYLHGLLLKQQVYSANRLLTVDTNQYQKCPVELEVQSPNLTYPIWHACEIDHQTAHWEGGTTPITTEDQTVYDGFGNVTKESHLGVVSGCSQSCSRPGDAYGEACGQGCGGDESYQEVSYVPRSATGGAWIIHAPYRQISYGKPNGLTTETLTYYDGMPFVGLAGALTQGLVSRVTVKSSDQGAVINASRAAYDANGEATDTLDPDGDPGNALSHRRHYLYDADGMRPVEVDILVGDHQLERKVTYDERFNLPLFATAWMRAQGNVVSGENASTFEYDSFGRVTAIHRPDPQTGVPAASPTQWFSYDLKDPGSQITTFTTLNGEHSTCIDGRGRTYQERTRVGAGSYLITGFSIFNKQGEVVQSFQPYSSASADCDAAPPTDAKASQLRYDAAHRLVQSTLPDGAIYPTASQSQLQYLPLETDELDPMDTDPQSPFVNTPTIRRFDGLGRLVAIGRTLDANQPPAFTLVTYDELGRMTGYVDSAGNRKLQKYDLAGRLVEIDDPNAGTTTFSYDDSGNLVSRSDARGSTVKLAYDGANRLQQRWDDADHDGTLTSFLYDADPACAQCSNAAARLAGVTFPGGKDSGGYDVRGRAIYGSRTLDNFAFESLYRYDDRDRLTSTTFPDGRSLTNHYDDGGRITAIDGVVSGISYDPRGLPGETDYANGTKELFRYDDVMRLSAQELDGPKGPLQALAYSRDRVGNLLSIADNSPDPTQSQLAASYGYDAWYRVTQAQLGGETLSYQFDAIDNILSAGKLGPYQYDPKRPNAVTQAGSLALQYDAAGNVTQRGNMAMSWDAFGRLTSAKLSDGDAAYSFGAGPERVLSVEPHGVTHWISGEYEVQDGLGVIYARLGRRRVARLVSTDLAAKLYAAGDLVADGKITAGDAWMAHQAAGTSASEASLLLSGARRTLYEIVPESSWLAHDHLGSNTIETDDQGAVIGRRAYTLFGAERLSSGDADRYGFTGQQGDATGAVHFAYRQLDSALGRWSGVDPLFARSTEQRVDAAGEATTAYAYVANSPASYADPSGLVKERVAKMIRSMDKGADRIVRAHGGYKALRNKAKDHSIPQEQREKAEKDMRSMQRGLITAAGTLVTGITVGTAAASLIHPGLAPIGSIVGGALSIGAASISVRELVLTGSMAYHAEAQYRDTSPSFSSEVDRGFSEIGRGIDEGVATIRRAASRYATRNYHFESLSQRQAEVNLSPPSL